MIVIPLLKRLALGALLLSVSACSTQAVAIDRSAFTTTAEGKPCAPIFQHKMKKLHSSKTLDLCEVVQGRPVLLINTASHCGFTKQFGDLEAIHEKYKDRGLVVIGVSSDSFDQEAKSEEEAATICFENFGVSFTMLATVPVKGENAHPLFQEVARQDTAPKWNFYKYLIDRDGKIISSNSSFTIPGDDDIEALLK